MSKPDRERSTPLAPPARIATLLNRMRTRPPASQRLTRWLFMRGLGLTFLIAFVSLWVQIHGLVGSNGILPAQEFLDRAHQALGADAYARVPTLCWIDSSDGSEHRLLSWGRPWLLARSEPFRTINGYGLFRRMTTSRPELILEGSWDGQTWEEIEFRWKPGDPSRRPAFVEPHQPRLDWQMWFAALNVRRAAHWLERLAVHILHGTPEVLDLLRCRPARIRLTYLGSNDEPSRRRIRHWCQLRPSRDVDFVV
jgi:hypothetical protein